MLAWSGPEYQSCDGLSRRGFLRVGSLGLGALTLPAILGARARAGADPVPPRSVIQVVLGGGPSPMETFDPKPDAPSDFRSGVQPIATALPGVFLAESMPRIARSLDRMALIRGMTHESADHTISLHRLMTGYATPQPRDRNERPSVGSVVARLRAADPAAMPPYVAMAGRSAFDGLFTGGAYLGPNVRPFEVNPDPDAAPGAEARLSPAPGLTLGRLRDRRALLRGLDQLDRHRDALGAMAGLDQYTDRAFAMIAGPAARRAFDLDLEPAATRDRYGRTRIGRSCLLARRLVESGVTFVTIGEGDWDHHTLVAEGCARQVPPLDAALASLVDDLSDRGLADSVLVVVWGEFGRTPRLNGAGGRDHWPASMSVLLAGGGLKMGQVVGASDPKGELAMDRPWRPEDLLRTIYHVLGVDPRREFPDEFGRPFAILDRGRPIHDLI